MEYIGFLLLCTIQGPFCSRNNGCKSGGQQSEINFMTRLFRANRQIETSFNAYCRHEGQEILVFSKLYSYEINFHKITLKICRHYRGPPSCDLPFCSEL